jgi:hypothetical protein
MFAAAFCEAHALVSVSHLTSALGARTWVGVMDLGA